MLDDPVCDVDEADRLKREPPVGDQSQLQPEGEHVRVGRREPVTDREPADPLVGDQPFKVDLDVFERQSLLRGGNRRLPR